MHREAAPGRPRVPPRHVEVVDVSELQQRPARDQHDEVEPALSPWLVLAVITLLIVTFIAATQLR